MLEETISAQIQEDKLRLQEEMFVCLANGERLNSQTLIEALNALDFWSILSADDAVGQRTIENVVARSTFDPNFVNRVLGTAFGPILHFSSTLMGSVTGGIRDMALEGFQAGSALVVLNIAKSIGSLLIETGAIFNGTSRGWNRGLKADLNIEVRELLMGISDGKALILEIEKASQTDIHLVSVAPRTLGEKFSMDVNKLPKQTEPTKAAIETSDVKCKGPTQALYIPSGSDKQKTKVHQEIPDDSSRSPKVTPPTKSL